MQEGTTPTWFGCQQSTYRVLQLTETTEHPLTIGCVLARTSFARHDEPFSRAEQRIFY